MIRFAGPGAVQAACPSQYAIDISQYVINCKGISQNIFCRRIFIGFFRIWPFTALPEFL
jgi:hypothetical protein